MMKINKLFLVALVFSTTCFTSCVWKQNGITKVLIKRQKFMANVTNIQLINHQFIFTGTNLDQVTSVKLKDGSTISTFAIASKAGTQLIIDASADIKLNAGRVMDFILSDAYSSVTFSVNFSLCNSTLGTAPNEKGFNCVKVPNDKDVLTYNGSTGVWEPSNVYGLVYVAVVNNGAIMPAGATTGQYYVVGTPGSIALDSTAPGTLTAVTAGQWVIYGDDNGWQVVDMPKSVTTFNNRVGHVMPKRSDYKLVQLADVTDWVTTPASAPTDKNFLVYDLATTKWKASATAPTDTVVTASIANQSVTAGKIADHTITALEIAPDTITNTEISTTAAIAGTKIGAIGIGAGTALPSRSANLLTSDSLSAALAKLQYIPTDYVSSAASSTMVGGIYDFNSLLTATLVKVPTPTQAMANANEAVNVTYTGSVWSGGQGQAADAVRAGTGKVGIGLATVSTTPATKLQVQVTAGATDGFQVDDGTYIGRFVTNGAGIGIGTFSNHPFSLYSNSTAQVSLSALGNFAIGAAASTPGKLDVVSASGDQKVNFIASAGNQATSITAAGTHIAEMSVGHDSSGATADRMVFGFDNTNSPGYGYWKGIAQAPLVLQPTGGLLGVGITNPDALIHIYSTSTTSNGLHIQAGGGAGTYIMKIADKGGLDKFYIEETGKVGIGTTSPSTLLHVAGTGITTTNLTISGTSTFTGTTVNTAIETGTLKITGGSPSAGKLLTSDASGNATWASGISGTANKIPKFATTTTVGDSIISDDGAGTVTVSGNLIVTGTITAQGAGGITSKLYTNSTPTNIAAGVPTWSDERFKKDIQTIPQSLNKILGLRGVSYNWRQDEFPERNFSSEKQIGVIAQEVERVFPEAVITDKSGYKAVSYGLIVGPIIQAIKEFYGHWFHDSKALHREIASIKAENLELKKENADIKAYLCSKDPKAAICK